MDAIEDMATCSVNNNVEEDNNESDTPKVGLTAFNLNY